MSDWKEAALSHAKVEDPKESVGLLLNVKGKERYYPCNNLSMSSYQCFVLDPVDYVQADSIGEITAIIHSHPVTPPTPSQADLVSCEDSNLPGILLTQKQNNGVMRAKRVQSSFVGKRMGWGVTDCWSLVRDWYREEKQIELKDYQRSMTPEEFLKNPLFEDYATQTGFRELEPNEPLQEGDVLLMSILHPTLNHVAIFLGDMVLHHLADRLSCREPYSPWLLKCTGKRFRYVA